MSAMDKVNNILGKLPFVKLAGNIPEGIRGKIPFLNVLIPFANHIASGAAIVVLVACFGGGGGGVASGNDFSYGLWDEGNSTADDFNSPAGLYIEGYSGKGGKVVIPATIEGYPVVGITGFMGGMTYEGKTSFYPAYDITEVVIPDTVEYIGGMAFFSCAKLKSLNLPASLKYIGLRAFEGCVELENITIPDSLSGELVSHANLLDSNKLPLKTRARLKELGFIL